MSHRQSYAEINLENLQHNTKAMFEIAGRPKFFCPMVKANAYGHGDVQVSQSLMDKVGSISHLGVGLVEEAIRLREHKIRTPLLVFGMFDSSSIRDVIENEITPVISALSELEHLNEELAKKQNRKMKIHLKFNTGMNRLGIDLPEADRFVRFLKDNRKFTLEGICTHLLNGEDAGSPDGESSQQLKKFFEVERKFADFPHLVHVLNSSAASNIFLRSRNAKTNEAPVGLGTRPGISIYGGEVTTQEKGNLDLRPVMSLKSKIALLHSIRKSEVVSYGGRWRAERDSLIGVVPIGYADGYYRNLSNQGEVLCHGEKLPVIGSVCMDYFMIDLTSIASKTKIDIGDEVVLFGKQNENQILASDLAKKVGTISYEVLARISSRVPRVYV